MWIQLTKLYVKVDTWLKTDEGATAMEYAILIGLIAVVIAGAVAAFGTKLSTSFTNSAKNIP